MSDDHKQALERFKLGTDAIAKQLKREEADLKFQIPEPEFQWSPEAQAMRAGSTIGTASVPAKPMLCIPLLDQPIQLVLNQEKAAQLGVQIHALNEEADDDTAEVIQGIYRRIEVDSRAGLARSWGYERAVKCGRGAYRVLTEYANDGGHWTDQKITIKRLLHQESAVLDPFAEEPDWSDGRWGFILSWMPWDRYKAKYPKSKLAEYADSELNELQTDQPDWMTGEGESRACLVAEYFRLETTSRTRVLLDDGSDSYDDEIPEGRSAKTGDDARSRAEDVPKLTWSVINAVEELEREARDGKYIPIVPVIGREIVPFNTERRWMGIISSNKDSQRVFNYAGSQAVLKSSLEPLQQTVIDPRQIEGYEAWWNNRNNKQLPYLPVIRDQQKGWGDPTLLETDNSQVGTSVLLMQQAMGWTHTGTGAFEAALGQGSPQNKTKGGILALQQQQEQGNSHFLDNLAEISITYEAKVVLDLIPYVYDRPGRIVRALDLEDNSNPVMLNRPFVRDAKGRPVAAPPQAPAGMMAPQGQPPAGQSPQMGQQPQAPKVLHYDLKKGQYGVVVSVGKSYQTRAQQGKDELGQLFQAEPSLFPILGDIYLKFADFPGHREAAERMKKMLPAPLQDQNDPQAAEQQIGQLKQAMQQQGEQLKQAAQVIQTKQVEQQARIAQTKIQASAQMQMAVMTNATKIAVARISAAKGTLDAMREDQEEQLALNQTQSHDANQNALDRQHEMNQAQMQHQQALEQASQAHDQATAQAEQGQQHTLEQGDQATAGQMATQQQAADLAPEPTQGSPE